MAPQTITPHTSTPAIHSGWAAAVAQAGRLQLGQGLPTVDLANLRAGERATLDTHARPDRWLAGEHEPFWSDESTARVVVTDQRILVTPDWRGGMSLWHVDLENLQLAHTDRGWHLDLHPVGINPRVRLAGDAAPLVAVQLACTVFPSTWARLSGLLPLLDSAA